MPRWRTRTSVGASCVIGAILFLACSAPAGSPVPDSTLGLSPAPTAVTTLGPARSETRPVATPPAPVAGAAPHGYATRLQIPFLQVDLPVLPGVMDADGDPVFPLCDVAQFLPFYRQPGESGTTYLYAHARQGMLLAMLQASEVDGGAAMVGEEVVVYTSDGWRQTYAITQVKPHATDYAIADDIAPGVERLVVQTSEGPVGDPYKLQVAAEPVTSQMVEQAEAVPVPSPRDCAPTT